MFLDSNKLKDLEKLNIQLSKQKQELINKYFSLFLEKNSKINLISKNDEKFLFEKHIYDSLAINLFFKNVLTGKTLLDIGTGGGFPAIPIALCYDDLNVFAVDSIRKKIRIIEEIKNELMLENLSPICDRVENITDKFDYVTSRAVGSLDLILKYASFSLKKDGYFIAYKSKKVLDEVNESKKMLKSLPLILVNIIKYELPLNESFERNLVIFKKVK